MHVTLFRFLLVKKKKKNYRNQNSFSFHLTSMPYFVLIKFKHIVDGCEKKLKMHQYFCKALQI